MEPLQTGTPSRPPLYLFVPELDTPVALTRSDLDTSHPFSSVTVSVLLLGGGPGVKVDFATLSFHVPTSGSAANTNPGSKRTNSDTARRIIIVPFFGAHTLSTGRPGDPITTKHDDKVRLQNVSRPSEKFRFEPSRKFLLTAVARLERRPAARSRRIPSARDGAVGALDAIEVLAVLRSALPAGGDLTWC